jgi:hypothetical protein
MHGPVNHPPILLKCSSFDFVHVYSLCSINFVATVWSNTIQERLSCADVAQQSLCALQSKQQMLSKAKSEREQVVKDDGYGDNNESDNRTQPQSSGKRQKN